MLLYLLLNRQEKVNRSLCKDGQARATKSSLCCFHIEIEFFCSIFLIYLLKKMHSITKL